MTARPTAHPLSSATAGALPGTWKLADGRAVTLRPASDGILRVAHGRLWATRDGPHGGRPEDAGDHVLEVGRSMLVRAGERVVIEAWTPGAASYFAWDPLPVPARAALPRPRIDFAALRQPLADLRAAAVLAALALVALGRGLALVAFGAWRGPRRVRACP